MMMKKKLPLILILSILLFILMTPAISADSNIGGNVIIDTPWAALQTSVEALPGIANANDVITLNITASDTLSGADIDYINSMSNLQSLITTDTVFFDYDGNSITGDMGNLFLDGNSNLINIAMINAIEFGDGAFMDATSLASVNLPNATIFGNTSFSQCDSLVIVSLPSATTFTNSFYHCDLLGSVDLPEATMFYSGNFQGCVSLTTVNIPKATYFGNFSFEACTSLVSISLPEVTSMGDSVFGACTSLTSINMPNVITFAYRPIYGCTALTSISFPNATTFGRYAFAENSALTSVDLPEAVTFGDGAFLRCSALTSVYLPKAETFGDRAFDECTMISTINLPSALNFGNDTFLDITLPIELTLGNTIPTVGSFAAGIPRSGSALNVPNGTIDAYDADLSGGGTTTDGLWYDWPLNELAAAVNPRTGDNANYTVVILCSVLLLCVAGIVMIRTAKQ